MSSSFSILLRLVPIVAVLWVSLSSALGQGRLRFNNSTNSLVATIADPTGSTLEPMRRGFVQLYYAPAGTEYVYWIKPCPPTLSQWLQMNVGWILGPVAAISSEAGLFDGGVVELSGIPEGGAIDYVVVGWTGTAGNFEEALQEWALTGVSTGRMRMNTGGGDPSEPPPNLASTFEGLFVGVNFLGFGCDYQYSATNGAITITGLRCLPNDLTVPDNINGQPVTAIGESAFAGCSALTNVTVPHTVMTLGAAAFANCTNLTAVYFLGDLPNVEGDPFDAGSNAVVYYLPGTRGWAASLGSRPTAPWVLPNPLILTKHTRFGVETNTFGFVISWATNGQVVVEGATNILDSGWVPISTNTLTEGWSLFEDPTWGNFSNRCYRVRSQ